MRSMNDAGAPAAAFGEFVSRAVPSARGPIAPPATSEGWDRRLAAVAEGLRGSLGLASAPDCDLEAEVLGVVERADYVIERLTFQSRPGVRVTANLYRPRKVEGRLPAVLSVHGHWKWARIDPTVQARCIGLARLGYVCLCVDAFGAGERAVAPAPGTYHGGPAGASLWAAGVPLIGLQVHDNRRAVDYLTSRPEVDPGRLAITGASGGGNQSLYAGALDDRLKVVAPVCGVGTLEAYLKAACCVCEVNPGGLTYATTGDLLAMMAPRALLVVSASQDAPQFSAGEAAKSLDYARPRFQALGAADRVRHVVIESGHDYNRPMREALYGWLDRWLRDRGDGGPVQEPDIEPEDPALLRCYPDAASRPPAVVSIPEFYRRESLARLASLPPLPDHRQAWEAEAVSIRARLAAEVLGGLPVDPPRRPEVRFDAGSGAWSVELESEPGIRLSGLLVPPDLGTVAGPARGLVILAGEEVVGAESARDLGAEWTRKGYATCSVELRALGRLKPETSPVSGAVDHNEAEWGVWIGRPLLGQWAFDLLRWIEALGGLLDEPQRHLAMLGGRVPLSLHARGAAGTAALVASAYTDRLDRVQVERSLVRMVGPETTSWEGVRMGLIAPNLLKFGDFGRIAALSAPRRLEVVEGLGADSEPLEAEALRVAFEPARRAYALFQAGDSLELRGSREDSRGRGR